MTKINQRTKTKWDNYTACGIAEGFDDPDNDFGTLNDKNIEAWAYLIKTGAVWSLQGWYGRTAAGIIEGGTIDKNGKINWAAVEAAREPEFNTCGWCGIKTNGSDMCEDCAAGNTPEGEV